MCLDNDLEIGVVQDVVTVSQERRQEGQSPEDTGEAIRGQTCRAGFENGEDARPQSADTSSRKDQLGTPEAWAGPLP